jgi:IS605 OrfB family transposase
MSKKANKLSRHTAKGRMFGGEAIIPTHPFLEDWGMYYQSILRTAVREMIDGATEVSIEKSYQSRFNIQWAVADSIAKEAATKVQQLEAARKNKIEALRNSIKSGVKYVAKQIKILDKKISKPKTEKEAAWIEKKLLGLKEKLLRIERNRQKLAGIESGQRLKVVFGGRKLFNAQHHLEENGYQSHSEWRHDWMLARSGNFYSIGNGSVDGGNHVIKIHHTVENWFTVTFAVPWFLREDYGDTIPLDFQLNPKYAGAVIWALNNNKPVTVRCFRREHKSEKWYISLTTYDVSVHRVSHKKNGAIGIDLNAESIDVACINVDGNLKWKKTYRLDFEDKSTGQSQAQVWNICADIVEKAENELCPIVIENLDFSKKKASMREQPKGYNRMLSQFCYDKFRRTLQSRCDKYGIQLIQVNPAYSSIIGMIKFMGRYGLNSGTAAGMTLARRGLRLSERLPRKKAKHVCPPSYSKGGKGGWRLCRPEDRHKHSWSLWNRVNRAMREHSITRHQLFAWTNPPEVLSASSKTLKRRGGRSKMGNSTSLVVNRQAASAPGGVTDAPEPIQLSVVVNV